MSSMLKTFLWLDDFRSPIDYIKNRQHYAISWVKTYDAFVEQIKTNGLPDIISFDHDLAPEHYPQSQEEMSLGHNIVYEMYNTKTGYDCAKWLVEYCSQNGLKLPEWHVHSANPAGAENIRKYLENASKHLGI